MPATRLLLCTDMDRTVIPNGRQPEHPNARKEFHRLCDQTNVMLVYVTGRHQQLVEEAIRDYELPLPDYAITDVGTKIYSCQKSSWLELADWQAEIAADWHGKTHWQLQQALSLHPQLKLQEQSKQNDFKLSYYLPLSVDRNKVMTWIKNRLTQLEVAASLIWSIDELEQIGLLDVLPRNATKLHGIEFLQHRLGYSREELLFAGDSGNDLPVLASPLQSVLVANAEDEVRQQACRLAAHNGCAETLFLAQPETPPLGGNYAAGVLQGVAHFAPQFLPATKGPKIS